MGNATFGTQIRRVRQNAGLTMEEFAGKLGVTKSSVNMWENKGVVPREDVLRHIAELYGVSTDILLGVNVHSDKTGTLQVIQRGLEKLDQPRLEKAQTMLETMFDDIFEEKDDEDI